MPKCRRAGFLCSFSHLDIRHSFGIRTSTFGFQILMIHVRQLVKDYADLRRGRFVALEGLSFDAVPGQVYGLLGPNGAGKTTALRILSTVLKPTSGSATVNGADVVTQPSQVRREIGFMSANTGVYDRMTAWEM